MSLHNTYYTDLNDVSCTSSGFSHIHWPSPSPRYSHSVFQVEASLKNSKKAPGPNPGSTKPGENCKVSSLLFEQASWSPSTCGVKHPGHLFITLPSMTRHSPVTLYTMAITTSCQMLDRRESLTLVVPPPPPMVALVRQTVCTYSVDWLVV